MGPRPALDGAFFLGHGDVPAPERKTRPSLQKAALLDRLIAGLCQSDIRRRFATVTAVFDVECHFLVVCKAREA